MGLFPIACFSPPVSLFFVWPGNPSLRKFQPVKCSFFELVAEDKRFQRFLEQKTRVHPLWKYFFDNSFHLPNPHSRFPIFLIFSLPFLPPLMGGGRSKVRCKARKAAVKNLWLERVYSPRVMWPCSKNTWRRIIKMRTWRYIESPP